MEILKEENLNKRAKEYYEKQLVSSVKEDFEQRRNERLYLESQWLLNMNFLSGKQYSHVNKRGEIIEDSRNYFWQNQNVFNHIAPVMELRLAKLNRVSPVIGVRPKSDDDREVERANVAEKLIENSFKKNNLTEVVRQATIWSETCGTAFYKIVWDEYGGNVVGEAKGKKIYEGEVKIMAISPFEIFPDSLNIDKIENCGSIIHAKTMPVSVIKSKYNIDVVGRDIDVISLSSNKYTSGKKNISKDSEIVIEKYIKPTVEYPNGRLIIVAGSVLVYDGELPYINAKNGDRTYPFIRQQAIEVAGSFFGMSIVERLIPVQRSFNAVKNRKHEFLNRLSMGVYAVEDGSIDVDDLENEGIEPGKIIVYRQGAEPPKLMEEGSMTSDFSEEEQKLLDEFIAISGVSDVSSSSKNASISSGSALELLISQDNERLTMVAENIRNCYLALALMSLKLYAEFTNGVRALKTIDSLDKTKIYYADKSVATSDDVYIENENELLYTERQKKDMIFKLYETGILFDEQGELRPATKEKILALLGYKDLDYQKGLSRLHEEKAQNENQNFGKKQVNVEYMDEHKIHIDEHTRYILNEYENLDENKKQLIFKHIEEHKKIINNNDKNKTGD